MQVVFNPELFALGLSVGVLGLILLLSLIIAYAYDERTLLGLAAYLSVMGALALTGDRMELGASLVEDLLLISGPSLVAALEMWLMRNRKVSKGDKVVMMAIALATLLLMTFFVVGLYSFLAPYLCLVWLALLVWSSGYLGIQSWETVGPWKWWLMVGHAGGLLVAMAFLVDLADASRASWPVLLMLLFQGPPIYLSLVWRSRLLNESRLRSAAANVTDPLTGLATTNVLVERLMRIMSRAQHGQTNTTLFLIEVQNWNGLLHELGPDFNETLLLEAALRLRRSIGDNDVAARITGGRFAVLAQGLNDQADVTALAMRLVVSGLRIDSPLLPGVELKFRVIVAAFKYDRFFNLTTARELITGLAAHFMAWPGSHRSRSILVIAY